MLKPHYVTIAAMATFISGVTQESLHATTSSQDQLKELIEAKKVVLGIPSRKSLADVLKEINEEKLICNRPQNSEGDTLIYQAFYKRNKDVVQACIAQCVKLGTCQNIIYTSARRNILHAAAASSAELLKMVLHDVPNIHTLIDQADIHSETPIIMAINRFDLESIIILKEAGANLNLKLSNMTPVMYAQWLINHQDDEADKTKLKQIIEILSKGPKEKL